MKNTRFLAMILAAAVLLGLTAAPTAAANAAYDGENGVYLADQAFRDGIEFDTPDLTNSTGFRGDAHSVRWDDEPRNPVRDHNPYGGWRFLEFAVHAEYCGLYRLDWSWFTLEDNTRRWSVNGVYQGVLHFTAAEADVWEYSTVYAHLNQGVNNIRIWLHYAVSADTVNYLFLDYLRVTPAAPPSTAVTTVMFSTPVAAKGSITAVLADGTAFESGNEAGQGDAIIFTAAALEGRRAARWSVNGETVSGETGGTFIYIVSENSAAVTTVTAYFAVLGNVGGRESGAVLSSDALLILQIIAGLDVPGACMIAADVNGDGVINSTDALWVLQIVAGFNPFNPAPQNGAAAP